MILSFCYLPKQIYRAVRTSLGDGRVKRSEAKKEVRKINNTAYSLEDKMASNYKMARKEYKVAKKNLKDERKNATTGLRY